MKKLKGLMVLALISSLLIPATVSAASSQDTTVPLQGGAFIVTSDVVNLSQVDLKNGQVLPSTGTTSLLVDDSTATGSGWNVKMSATDFLLEVTDRTNSGKMTVGIPISNAKVQLSNLTSVAGAGISGIHNNAESPLTILDTAQVILQAESGSGMGKYDSDLAFSVNIPSKVKVTNVAAGSNFSVGDDVGIFAGTYTSTITITISKGP